LGVPHGFLGQPWGLPWEEKAHMAVREGCLYEGTCVRLFCSVANTAEISCASNLQNYSIKISRLLTLISLEHKERYFEKCVKVRGV